MEKTRIVCDECKKTIKEGVERRYMLVYTIGYPNAYNDGGSFAAVDREEQTFHLHYDCSRKIFKVCPKLIPTNM